MEEVVLAEGSNPYETLKIGISLFSELSLSVLKDQNICLLIDLPLPQLSPMGVEPDTIFAVIRMLQREEPKQIFVLPAVWDMVRQEEALQYYGLNDFFKREHIIVLQYPQLEFTFTPTELVSISVKTFSNPLNPSETFKTTSLPELEQKKGINTRMVIDQWLIISKIRSDPYWKLWTGLSIINHWFSPSMREKFPIPIPPASLGEDPFLWQWKILVNLILHWKKPWLVIYDAFSVLEGHGICLGASPKIRSPHQLILSDDLIKAEYFVLHHFDIDRNKIPWISLFPLDSEEHFPPKCKTSSNVHTPYPLIPASQEISDYPLPGLTLCCGELDAIERYGLLQILHASQILLLKDAFNLKSWAIIVGKNPKIQHLSGPILVIGKRAIESTQMAAFRFREKKSFLSTFFPPLATSSMDSTDTEEDTLEKQIVIRQSKIRKKMEKYRVQQAEIKEKLESKEDPLEKRQLILSLEIETQSRVQKYQNRIENIRHRLVYKHAVVMQKARVQHLTIDKNVIDIAGSSLQKMPNFMEIVLGLTHLCKKSDIPTVRLFHKLSARWYFYPTFRRDQMKSVWKQQQKLWNAEFQQKYAPIQAEVKENLQDIHKKYKKQQHEYKKQAKTVKSTLLSPFLIELNQVKRQIMQNKSRKKQKIDQIEGEIEKNDQ